MSQPICMKSEMLISPGFRSPTFSIQNLRTPWSYAFDISSQINAGGVVSSHR